jgi:hypothetical protein
MSSSVTSFVLIHISLFTLCVFVIIIILLLLLNGWKVVSGDLEHNKSGLYYYMFKTGICY